MLEKVGRAVSQSNQMGIARFIRGGFPSLVCRPYSYLALEDLHPISNSADKGQDTAWSTKPKTLSFDSNFENRANDSPAKGLSGGSLKLLGFFSRGSQILRESRSLYPQIISKVEIPKPYAYSGCKISDNIISSEGFAGTLVHRKVIASRELNSEQSQTSSKYLGALNGKAILPSSCWQSSVLDRSGGLRTPVHHFISAGVSMRVGKGCIQQCRGIMVEVRHNDLERAIRRWRRKCKEENLKSLKDREYFRKPSEKRVLALKERDHRIMKRAFKQKLNWIMGRRQRGF